MAGRPVDQQRRDELLDAVVDYAVERGLAAVTWRPVAAMLGVTPTTLVHRFGSKEQMLQEVQARLRERVLVATAAPADAPDVDLASYGRRVWEHTSDPAREGEFRLLFAVYGQALQAPDVFADFLDHVVAEPLRAFTAGDPDRTRDATLLLAVLRGLLLDLLTTGDRARIDAAAVAFFATTGGVSPSGPRPPGRRPTRG